MPSSKRKSPAAEGKRKTRASDKARTSVKKSVNRKKTVSVDNDGSYLQVQASSTAPVSTILPPEQSHMSASTGQTILTMLQQIHASNKELSRRMDTLERNGSMSSTPRTSPSVQHRSSTVAAPQPVVPRPVHEVGATSAFKENQRTSGVGNQTSSQNTFSRDAIVPGVDVLRSIPSISSAVTQLLASYDQQAVQNVLPGKGHITRRKSGRYNTTDTTLVGPQFRWPNEGLISASRTKKPAYDELTLAQWISGQLSNVLLIDDPTLVKNVLTQVVLAMKDAVSLPWQAVRSAWAVSMTEIEEGRLGLADSTQWSLNRISNSQLAVMISHNASSMSQKTRICKFFNEGTCTSEGHHGSYKHFCANCYKQGRSLAHPETRCFSRTTTRAQDQSTPTSK